MFLKNFKTCNFHFLKLQPASVTFKHFLAKTQGGQAYRRFSVRTHGKGLRSELKRSLSTPSDGCWMPADIWRDFQEKSRQIHECLVAAGLRMYAGSGRGSGWRRLPPWGLESVVLFLECRHRTSNVHDIVYFCVTLSYKRKTTEIGPSKTPICRAWRPLSSKLAILSCKTTLGETASVVEDRIEGSGLTADTTAATLEPPQASRPKNHVFRLQSAHAAVNSGCEATNKLVSIVSTLWTDMASVCTL